MYTEDQDTSPENPLNLDDRHFRIAFAFETTEEAKIINDPRYVRWIFEINGWKDGKWIEESLPYH